jgi:hypothetical protein
MRLGKQPLFVQGSARRAVNRVAVNVAVNRGEARKSYALLATVSYGKTMEGPVGFEPTTPGLKVRSSTAELRAQ